MNFIELLPNKQACTIRPDRLLENIRKGIILSRCGAVEARMLITDSYDQALNGLRSSVRSGNRERQLYWIDRLKHLIGELNWIDNLIRELGADATQSNPPS